MAAALSVSICMYNNWFRKFLLFPLFFLFVSPVFAVTMTLQSDQTTIQSSDEYNVNITFSIQQPDGTKYYLRGVFYKPDTSDYCGYTWNSSSWFSGPITDGWKNFLPITILGSSWSGQLKTKIDTTDSGCKDSGSYNFRVQRFTDNSNSGTFDSQNALTLAVAIPTPTPTPMNTPMQTPTNTQPQTNTPTSSPTTTNTPTFMPTKTPTRRPSPSSTPSDTPTPQASSTGEVLSLSDTENATPTATPSGTLKPLIISFALVGAGTGILSLLALWQKRSLFLHPKPPIDQS